MADKNYEKESAEDMDIDIPVSEEEPDALQKEIDDLTAKLEESENKIAEVDDKYLRLCAEYDNYRKRTSKEKTEIYNDAVSKTVAEILPAIDNFERALEAETSDDSYKNGIQMIFNQLQDILKKVGVTEIEALNQPFNPNIHVAIKQLDDEDFGESTVCQVFQKGYRLGDRIVRPAMVAVAN